MPHELEEHGPLYSRIGGEIAHIVGGEFNEAFLYAEVGDGWVGAGVFKDERSAVRYFDPSSALCDMLLEAWKTSEPAKRWAVVEYSIIGSKFDAQFLFPDQIDPEESEYERRPRALKRRFGDKPVIYPPMPSVDR